MLTNLFSLVVISQAALILTGPARAATVPHNRVFSVVFVPVRAVRDSGFSCAVADSRGGFSIRQERRADTYSPGEIFALRDRLKVLRVDAASNAAFVIQDLAIRDHSYQQLIGDFVRNAASPGTIRTLDVRQRISVFCDAFEPKPTASVRLWRNTIFDSFDKITKGHSILLEIGCLGLRGAVNAVCGPFLILPCHNISISAD
jgi:hypothetical protein